MIKAGGDPAHCTFAGVGKTRDEIVYALEKGIYSFNVESEEELRYLNEVAGELGMVAPAAVRVASVCACWAVSPIPTPAWIICSTRKKK